jgi:hypothetical protein
MLHEFLSTNRADLISRCRGKVTQRDSPRATASELEHGIPLILNQLFEALVHEHASSQLPAEIPGTTSETRASIESTHTAGLHGAELFKLGYTLSQVVHDYGDLCQAITEAAIEKNASITVSEFHTFNHLLDNAIASAVSAFGALQHASSYAAGGAQGIHNRLGALADEQRQLVDTAFGALDALKRGNVGLMGATGAVLEDSLARLRATTDQSLPEIRLASGMVTPPPVN